MKSSDEPQSPPQTSAESFSPLPEMADLCSSEAQQAYSHLKEVLLQDSYTSSERSQALKELVSHLSTEDGVAFLGALLPHLETNQQATAASLLGKSGSTLALEHLLTLQDNTHPNVKGALYSALGKLAHPASAPLLYQGFLEGEESQIYHTALKALKKFGLTKETLEHCPPVDALSTKSAIRWAYFNAGIKQNALRAMLYMQDLEALIEVYIESYDYSSQLEKLLQEHIKELPSGGERLGFLRALLALEPSRSRWTLLKLILNAWPEGEFELELGIDYLRHHLDESEDIFRSETLYRGVGPQYAAFPLIKRLSIFDSEGNSFPHEYTSATFAHIRYLALHECHISSEKWRYFFQQAQHWSPNTMTLEQTTTIDKATIQKLIEWVGATNLKVLRLRSGFEDYIESIHMLCEDCPSLEALYINSGRDHLDEKEQQRLNEHAAKHQVKLILNKWSYRAPASVSM